VEQFFEAWNTFRLLLAIPFGAGWMDLLVKFIPFVLFLELPVYLFILLGVVRYALRRDFEVREDRTYSPKVSCLITCYSEGLEVQRTIVSLAEQRYAGHIEIIALIDGAAYNTITHEAALAMEPYVRKLVNRSLRVVPKWQRGGRVSSLNLGLHLANGSVIMAVDGDTSFDNDMVLNATRHFENPNVVAVAGCLRVRNWFVNLLTRLQAIEYLLSIQASKVGLSEFNVVNNVSGAFGIFRRSFIEKIGGWDTGTAEDLDMTLRIKNYFGRHPHLRIVFEPRAMGHTDAPATWIDFFRQRQRWDGDLYYLYIRKHMLSFSPSILGWRNLILQVWTGLFFQVIMPFIILFYSLALFLFHPPGLVAGIWLLVYFFYLLISIVFFVAHILFVSENRAEDLRFAWLLPLIPHFTFFQRIGSALATLREIVCRSHLDSSMAPWWVLRKSKF
jgi:cellulose synthase/poly-beta-1,6-N-acetylglucosamine synthase-like glycosyltransferase